MERTLKKTTQKHIKKKLCFYFHFCTRFVLFSADNKIKLLTLKFFAMNSAIKKELKVIIFKFLVVDVLLYSALFFSLSRSLFSMI
jgi:hypothetical protein